MIWIRLQCSDRHAPYLSRFDRGVCLFHDFAPRLQTDLGLFEEEAQTLRAHALLKIIKKPMTNFLVALCRPRQKDGFLDGTAPRSLDYVVREIDKQFCKFQGVGRGITFDNFVKSTGENFYSARLRGLHVIKKVYIALRRSDGAIAGPYPVIIGDNEYEVAPQVALDIVPYVGGEAERTHYAFGPSDAWSLLARVLAIRPRGERVEIAAVGEHDGVHVN